MSRLLLLGLAVLTASSTVYAQETTGPCAAPATVAVRGNSRVAESTIRSEAGLAPRTPLNYREVQRAVKALYATGQFDDVQITCTVDAGGSSATLVIQVRERLILDEVAVEGVDRVSAGSVRDRVDLVVGRPLDPAQVTRSITRIDSLYEAQGYFLARVRPETTVVNGRTKLTFHVDEGSRLAVSGVRVNGNQQLSDKTIVGAMETRPEGFWWFRKGEFDEDKYAADLAEKIPQLYARNGYVDFQVTRDTLVVDRDRGKALIDLTVTEGPRYQVGDFEVLGARRFSSDEIERFYPFTDEGPTLVGRITGLVRRRPAASNVFDRAAWEEATQRVQTAYTNEGYISAQVRPVVERTYAADSTPVVNLRWEIQEGTPSIINRIDIAGNDHTTEACIRNSLVIVPGDVFNQDRLIRSYQNIANMGFFETPLPTPDTRPDSAGDVDITFRVKEKQTGNVNFGASMGQGTGVGGFIGLTQPNLFGRCKNGSLNWQFGRYINDFSLSYTDPAIRQSQISGTVTGYRSQARYRIAELGQNIRTGGSVQAGFPVPGSPYTRLFVSYGGEAARFGSGGLLGTLQEEFAGTSYRSTLGFTAAHDTRIDLPFPTAGGQRTFTAQFNGGPLGGTADFQRYTGEIRSFATLAQIGGSRPGSQPIKFVLGLTGRGGAVFGNTGAFFVNNQFSLGGVQFGEALRGYPEFSIAPDSGFLGNTDQFNATRGSFGNAFFTTTAELGMRINQMFYVNAFYDAGNVYSNPRNFDPTRLFRGAGIGLSTITPLGPLGIDYAYGFDRTERDPITNRQRPAPKWQFHFRLGQLF
jgi:outer membrane protein insertion porin family